jgi:hypothetical protein
MDLDEILLLFFLKICFSKKRVFIQFTLQKPQKKIKYLRINLTKDANGLYKENYKLLKKEIIEDHRRWKDLPCS